MDWLFLSTFLFIIPRIMTDAKDSIRLIIISRDTGCVSHKLVSSRQRFSDTWYNALMMYCPKLLHWPKMTNNVVYIGSTLVSETVTLSRALIKHMNWVACWVLLLSADLVWWLNSLLMYTWFTPGCLLSNWVENNRWRIVYSIRMNSRFIQQGVLR